MVRTLTEVQQLTASEEMTLLGIVRAEQQEFFGELRIHIAIECGPYESTAAPIYEVFWANLKNRQSTRGAVKCRESCDGCAFARQAVRTKVKDEHPVTRNRALHKLLDRGGRTLPQQNCKFADSGAIEELRDAY